MKPQKTRNNYVLSSQNEGQMHICCAGMQGWQQPRNKNWAWIVWSFDFVILADCFMALGLCKVEPVASVLWGTWIIYTQLREHWVLCRCRLLSLLCRTILSYIFCSFHVFWQHWKSFCLLKDTDYVKVGGDLKSTWNTLFSWYRMECCFHKVSDMFKTMAHCLWI